MLELKEVSVAYGDMQVLREVNLTIEKGEIVALVGANAAGKTTLVNTISGLVPTLSGSILFNGENLTHLPPNAIVARGIVQVPEGRKLFPKMTVLENLELGAFASRARSQRQDTLKKVMELLPVLAERQYQLAGSLSGGEQQMCSIGRGLMACPELLILDEPSLGLAPIMVQKMFDIVREINRMGTTILLIEQNVRQSLAIAHRGYVLENGRIVLAGPAADLMKNEYLKKAYLGL
ncbi:MAG: ABC transporter ATP-binding protein [bacterium]